MAVSWSKAISRSIRWLGICGLVLASIDVARGQSVSRAPVKQARAEYIAETEEPGEIPEWSPTRARSSASPRAGSPARNTGRAPAPQKVAQPATNMPAARRAPPVRQENDDSFQLASNFRTSGSTVRRAPQRVATRSSRQIQMPGEMMEEGTIVEGETWTDGDVFHEGGSSSCNSCGGGSCGDSCGDEGCDSCGSRRGCRGLLRRGLFDGCCDMGGCDECSPWIEENECDDCRRWWRHGRCRPCHDWCLFDDLTVFGGMAGFKGPVDIGVNGNFGFSYGVNWGAPLWDRFGLGLQLGYRGVSSNLSGEPISGTVGQVRQQDFFTGGIFRRFSSENLGYWQSGAVIDVVSDNYYTQMQLSQVRFEISHFIDEKNEIGFLGAFRSEGDTGTLAGLPINWQAQNQYLGFYRHQWARGAQSRLWGGATDTSDGLFGFDYSAPLSASWGIQAAGNYLIPSEGKTAAGQVNEAWGLGINVVWFPVRNGYQAARSPYRPLFDVADNSSFLTEVVP